MNENLPELINYHGYQIRPIPRKIIIDSAERWNTTFEIWEHTGRESTVFPFNGSKTFELKDQATKYCYSLGRHIIDNEPQKLIKRE